MSMADPSKALADALNALGLGRQVSKDDEVVQALAKKGCVDDKDAAVVLVEWKADKSEFAQHPTARACLAKLEVLGELLIRSGSIGAWQVALGSKFGDLFKLREAPWEEVAKVLEENNASHTARDIVAKLFAEDHPLRMQLLERRMPLGVADKLGATNFAGVDKSELDRVLKDQDLALRPQAQLDLRALWSSAQGEKAKCSEKQQRNHEEAKVRVEKAMKLAGEARTALQAGKDDAGVQQSLAKVREQLKLPPDWNEGNLDDPSKMLDDLESTIAKYAACLPEPATTMEEVVGLASEGRVRYAVFKDAPHKSPHAPLIEAPRLVEHLGHSDSTERRTHQSFEKGFSERFAKAVANSGYSGAAEASASGALGGVGAAGGSAGGRSRVQEDSQQERDKQKRTCAERVECIHAPRQAFRIDLDNVKLTDEAYQAAAVICTTQAAREFLQRFGIYFPFQKQRVGGVLLKSCVVQAYEAVEESQLLNAAASKTHGNASGGLHGLLWSASLSAECEFTNAEGQSQASAKAVVKGSKEYSFKALGPQCFDHDSFVALLDGTNKSWALIDRGDPKTFKPVWEILAMRPELKNQARLVERVFMLSQLKPGESEPEHWVSTNILETAVVVESMLKDVSVSEEKTNQLLNDIDRVQEAVRRCTRLEGDETKVLEYLFTNTPLASLINGIVEQKLGRVAAQLVEFLPASTMQQLQDKGVGAKFTELTALGVQAGGAVRQEAQPPDYDPKVLEVSLESLPKYLRDVHKQSLREEQKTQRAERALSKALEKADELRRSAVARFARSFGFEESAGFAYRKVDLAALSDGLEDLLVKHPQSVQVGSEVTMGVGTARMGRDSAKAVGSVKAVGHSSGKATVRWLQLEQRDNSGRCKSIEFKQQCSSPAVFVAVVHKIFQDSKRVEILAEVSLWDLVVKQAVGGDDWSKEPRVGKVSVKSALAPESELLHLQDLVADLSSSKLEAGSKEEVIFHLVHRMGFEQLRAGAADGAGQDSENDALGWDDSSDEEGAQGGEQFVERNILSRLIELFHACALDAKLEVVRHLSLQGYSVPFVTTAKDERMIVHDECLRFLTFERRDVVSLLHDKTLPRIAFASMVGEERATVGAVVEQLFSCKLLSTLQQQQEVGTFAELVVGTVGEQPWLVLNVRGEFGSLWKLLEAFCFTIVVQVTRVEDFKEFEAMAKRDMGSAIQTPQDVERVVLWLEEPGRVKFHSALGKNYFRCVRGDRKNLPQFLKDKLLTKSSYLQKHCEATREEVGKRSKFGHAYAASDRELLWKSSEYTHSIQDIVKSAGPQRADEVRGANELEQEVDGLEDFGMLRGWLVLQRSFAEMWRCKFKALDHNLGEQEEQECKRKIGECGRKLKNMADVQEARKHSLLRLVGSIHHCQQPAARALAVAILEAGTARRNAIDLASEYREQREAELEMQRASQSGEPSEVQKRLKRAFYSARERYVGRQISMDVLWREASHIHNALQEKDESWGICAAERMLDGFPLELMDGAAGACNLEWVQFVLRQVNSGLEARLGHEPKVFVLSVMGVQSAGKSTLLNVMFGCQLRASAGRCTQGMTMQLLPSNREGLDFVLLLDTEGIRAPEFFGLPGADARDNRIATFSMLAADACVILSVGENDEAIKEIIPIVMLARKRVQLLQNKPLPKVIFTYNRVNTDETDKLQHNRTALLELLAKSARELGGEGGEGGGGGSELLRGFDPDQDIHYLGDLRDSAKFGREVSALREAIVRRSPSPGTLLVEWTKLIGEVHQCLETASFELSFKAVQDHHTFTKLHNKVQTLRPKVNKIVQDVVNKARAECLRASRGGRVAKLDPILARLAATQEVTDELHAFLDETDRFRNHKDEWESKWDSFVASAESQCRQQVAGIRISICEVRVMVDNEERTMMARMKEWVDGQHGHCDPHAEATEKKFNQLWEESCVRVDQCCDSAKVNVDSMVRQKYRTELPSIKLDAGSHGASGSASWVDMVRPAFLMGKVKQWYGSVPAEEKIDQAMQGLKIRQQLEEFDRYSDEAVLLTIQHTTKCINEANITDSERDLQAVVHHHARDDVIEVLTEKQRKWEEKNDPTTVYESRKGVMWNRFVDMCKGLQGVESGTKELCRSLQAMLNDGGALGFLADVLTSIIQGATFVQSHEVLEAEMDLRVLDEYDRGQNQKVFGALRHPCRWYETVYRELVRKEVETNLEGERARLLDALEGAVRNWERCRVPEVLAEQLKAELNKILDTQPDNNEDTDLEDAIKKVRDLCSGGPRVDPHKFLVAVDELQSKAKEAGARFQSASKMLADVRAKLDEAVPSVQQLSDKILERIEAFPNGRGSLLSNWWKPKFSDPSVKLDREALQSIQTELVEILERFSWPANQLDQLAEHMWDKVPKKCGELCAPCSSMCTLPRGHAGRHFTEHRVQGVGATRFIETKKLVAESCTQAVQSPNASYVVDENSFKYCEWTEHEVFKNFERPTEGYHKHKVSEFIFANCQSGLAAFHSAKECDEVPEQYNHSLGQLRKELLEKAKRENKD